MKRAKAKISFFRRIVALATDNWGLKLLALLLAVVIYYSMKPSDGALQKTKFERTDERSTFQQP